MFCIIFICVIIKINYLYLLEISLTDTLKALVWYGYVAILLKVYNLLSSLLLSAILLISSIYKKCALLNHCCGFNIILLLNKQFL